MCLLVSFNFRANPSARILEACKLTIKNNSVNKCFVNFFHESGQRDPLLQHHGVAERLERVVVEMRGVHGIVDRRAQQCHAECLDADRALLHRL